MIYEYACADCGKVIEVEAVIGTDIEPCIDKVCCLSQMSRKGASFWRRVKSRHYRIIYPPAIGSIVGAGNSPSRRSKDA